jgi:hypothetical protein
VRRQSREFLSCSFRTGLRSVTCQPWGEAVLDGCPAESGHFHMRGVHRDERSQKRAPIGTELSDGLNGSWDGIAMQVASGALAARCKTCLTRPKACWSASNCSRVAGGEDRNRPARAPYHTTGSSIGQMRAVRVAKMAAISVSTMLYSVTPVGKTPVIGMSANVRWWAMVGKSK